MPRATDGTVRMSVDHDHESGKIRGILCAGCNKGLGHFRDDPDVLMRAAMYLCEGVIHA